MGKKLHYIPKKNLSFAQLLAKKTYLGLLLKEKQQELKSIELYLKNAPQTSKSEILLHNPLYQPLLQNHFVPVSDELSAWMAAPYDRNLNHPENLIHKGASGIYMRSKSEAIIELFLYTNRIPFRYECPIQIGESILYPDFTIRHPITGKTFYWEHFGMIDQPNYSYNAFSKLHLYSTHEIIPSINLITTFETKEYPFSPEMAHRIIKDYFQ